MLFFCKVSTIFSYVSKLFDTIHANFILLCFYLLFQQNSLWITLWITQWIILKIPKNSHKYDHIQFVDMWINKLSDYSNLIPLHFIYSRLFFKISPFFPFTKIQFKSPLTLLLYCAIVALTRKNLTAGFLSSRLLLSYIWRVFYGSLSGHILHFSKNCCC